jgi:hypothetical protein
MHKIAGGFDAVQGCRQRGGVEDVAGHSFFDPMTLAVMQPFGSPRQTTHPYSPPQKQPSNRPPTSPGASVGSTVFGRRRSSGCGLPSTLSNTSTHPRDAGNGRLEL